MAVENSILAERKRIIFGVRKLTQTGTGANRETFKRAATILDPAFGEEEELEKKVDKKSMFDRFIIKETSKLKAGWDIYINFMVAYSCFTTIYAVCFVSETTPE